MRVKDFLLLLVFNWLTHTGTPETLGPLTHWDPGNLEHTGTRTANITDSQTPLRMAVLLSQLRKKQTISN